MILDESGVLWDVWEVQPAANEKRRADHPVPPPGMSERRASRSQRSPKRAGWLAMQNERERRRVVPAPSGWMEMTDDELGMVIAAAAGTGRPLVLEE